MKLVEDFDAKVNISTRTFSATEVKIILRPLICVSHILTVSNYQVCSDHKFDL